MSTPKVMISNVELVSIDGLTLHPRNRNKHPEDQIKRLARILEYQGFRYPVKVSKRSGYVTSGHGRIEAARLNGWTHVPVSYQEYDSDEQEYADLIADNSIASWAELDLSGINADLGDLGPDFDLDLLGLRDFNLEPAEKIGLVDEDQMPENVETRAKPGDLWLLGEHRLLCGDATNINHVERLMAGHKADMVWTDPPYNVAYEGKTKDALKIQNDEMSSESFYQFLYDAHSNMLIFTNPGGAIYVAHADSEGMNFRKALIDSGWLLKQCLIWVKQTLVMGRQDYHWKHEPILYGWAPGASHNWYSDRKQTTVLEFDRPFRNAEHPTMKPIELINYCLTNSCPSSGKVLDLFGGSGSTLIACEKTNRKCFTMEIDPHYCSVILKRWEDFTGQIAQLHQDPSLPVDV